MRTRYAVLALGASIDADQPVVEALRVVIDRLACLDARASPPTAYDFCSDRHIGLSDACKDAGPTKLFWWRRLKDVLHLETGVPRASVWHVQQNLNVQGTGIF
jgi:hypothetical protein